MKTALALLVTLTLCSCTSAFKRVQKAHTLEQARGLLQGYEPKVTKYEPNAEAWYFEKGECILFVDGQQRLAKSVSVTVEEGHARPSMTKPVTCIPSEL